MPEAGINIADIPYLYIGRVRLNTTDSPTSGTVRLGNVIASGTSSHRTLIVQTGVNDVYICYDNNTGWKKFVLADKIANNLTTTSANYVLDARQGKILNDNRMKRSISYIYDSTNVNSCTDTATCYSTQSANIPNTPGQFWNIYNFENGWGVIQLAINYTASSMKMRAKYDSTWSSWTTIK